MKDNVPDDLRLLIFCRESWDAGFTRDAAGASEFFPLDDHIVLLPNPGNRICISWKVPSSSSWDFSPNRSKFIWSLVYTFMNFLID